MAARRIAPPWNYLHDASIASLQSFELSRLNHAANMRREMTALLDQWIEDNAQALLARWVRENRALDRERPAEFALQPELPFSEPRPLPEPHSISTPRPVPEPDPACESNPACKPNPCNPNPFGQAPQLGVAKLSRRRACSSSTG